MAIDQTSDALECSSLWNSTTGMEAAARSERNGPAANRQYMDTSWPVAFISILDAGLVAVPLPVETPLATAAGIAAFAEAPVAIVGTRTRGLASANSVRCVPVDQLIESRVAPAAARAGPMPELALLAFTSGSTTQPRAVELTHANLLANLEAALQLRQAAPGDSFLSMLPPAHLFELMGGLLGPLACVARVVYAPSLLPNRILAALRDERITHALSVPALLQVLYEEVVSELVDAGVLDPAQRDQSLAETARRLREGMDEHDRTRLRASVRERIGHSLRLLLVVAFAFAVAVFAFAVVRTVMLPR